MISLFLRKHNNLMSKTRVAINGFGRIGRITARAILTNPELELVAINDIADANTMAHLFKYDSVQGKFDGTIEVDEKSLLINDNIVYLYASKNPEDLPWKDLKIDVVVESTGIFRTHETASKHLKAGAKKVILSAPPKGDGIKQIIVGVNDNTIESADVIISNASCTTNCAAPIVKIFKDNFTIQKAILTTTHAYTSDQSLQDAPHSDLRRARAAAQNIIPTSTGASAALEKVFPDLSGSLTGTALRVPVAAGSITELTFLLKELTSKNQVDELVKIASENEFKGILQYTNEPLVSSDIIGNPHSSVFDSELTTVMGNLVKISSWYDNEVGYSNRLVDLIIKLKNIQNNH